MPGHRKAKQLKNGKARKICGAIKQDGTPCLGRAGFGTDHLGTGRCKFHGGQMGNGEVAAAREEANSFAKPLDHVTPAVAIQAVLALASGQLVYASTKVANLDEEDMFDGESPNRWIRLQRDLMDRLASYSKAATDMGVSERQVALAERQAQLMHQIIEATFKDLNLTQAQRERLGPVLRKHMAAVIESTATETTKQLTQANKAQATPQATTPA